MRKAWLVQTRGFNGASRSAGFPTQRSGCESVTRRAADYPKPHFKTMLTSFPGTVIILATSRPSSAALTFSSARAASRSSESLAPALANIRLRSFPLTWIATSISSSRASSALNSGHCDRDKL